MSTTPKRKHSITADEEQEVTTNNKRQSPDQEQNTTAAIAPQTPLVSLPPPLMQYPNGQLVSIVHPQQPYYHVYHHHQQPIYYPISPQQHPFIQPAETSTKKSSTPRILPKNPDMIASPALSPHPHPHQQQSPLASFYHPYNLQMSPTMMPSPYIQARHDSLSSLPCLSPAATSTADQREKARKVSHSAIERRRRERINDKILQLKQLIPSCVEQDNLHKMSILQSAIDYITYLKDIVKKLDENGDSSDELLKGDHLKVKTQKSMLPKEVEPFTNQFSVHPIAKTQQQRRSNTVEHQKGLKPMDVLKSSTRTITAGSTGTAPLTPPQEPAVNNNNTSLDSARSSIDEPKHMSLQNILC